jgi:hypothetical protein
MRERIIKDNENVEGQKLYDHMYVSRQKGEMLALNIK